MSTTCGPRASTAVRHGGGRGGRAHRRCRPGDGDVSTGRPQRPHRRLRTATDRVSRCALCWAPNRAHSRRNAVREGAAPRTGHPPAVRRRTRGGPVGKPTSQTSGGDPGGDADDEASGSRDPVGRCSRDPGPWSLADQENGPDRASSRVTGAVDSSIAPPRRHREQRGPSISYMEGPRPCVPVKWPLLGDADRRVAEATATERQPDTGPDVHKTDRDQLCHTRHLTVHSRS